YNLVSLHAEKYDRHGKTEYKRRYKPKRNRYAPETADLCGHTEFCVSGTPKSAHKKPQIDRAEYGNKGEYGHNYVGKILSFGGHVVKADERAFDYKYEGAGRQPHIKRQVSECFGSAPGLFHITLADGHADHYGGGIANAH